MKKQVRFAALCAALMLGATSVTALSEAVSDAEPQPAAASADSTQQEQQSTPEEEQTQAEAPDLLDCGLDMLDHSVHYPQLTGMQDEALQAAVNDAIIETGRIQELIDRLPLVLTSEVPLKASYTAAIKGDVLSVCMQLSGPVYNMRPTHEWRTINIDLLTGEAITLDNLFTDPDAGKAALETYLEDEVAPLLSAHLLCSEVTPLPEHFTLDAQGLTLYYPIDRLSTLSSRAGAVNLQWYELDSLDLDDGGILARIGAQQSLTLSEHSPALISACVESGSLPGIPVQLGGSMKEATDAYRMLIDPDLCEGGRMFSLEDAAFRSIYLLTDALQRGWDNSEIQGIRADRINLYGLCTGITQRQAWLDVLGTPTASVVLDAERAEAWRLPAGISDYYTYGPYRLRLHSDEQGVLTSLFLIP